MKILAITTIIFVFSAGVVLPAQIVENKYMFVSETVTEATDIHYTGQYCTECHKKTPKKGEDKLLKFDGDYTQLCRCHGYTPGTYIHPVEMVPSEEKLAVIPKDFPLQEGKVTCSTCHDIYMQCQYSAKFKSLNRRFLRGAPYAHRTDLCFKCHDEKKYKMLDPHNQLDSSGNIVIEKCLYCHVEKPDEKKATYQDVKLIGGLEVLCQRCHGERDHPSGKPHLRQPSDSTLALMKQGEKDFAIVLPLDAEGKVSCPTCHNPHEKGVIPAEREGAKGAGEKFRHRLPGNICVACHSK